MRKRFVYSLLEIYEKKDESVKDCADFIRKAVLYAFSEKNSFKINGKRIFLPNLKNIRTPFLVKEEKFFYSSFSDVKNLILYNTKFLGKDKKEINLKSGDLLFFYNPNQKMPYHSMVYIKIKDREYLIYHTGPDGEEKGEFKLINYNFIFNHPNPVWYPIPSNENFLGFFRFNFFEN